MAVIGVHDVVTDAPRRRAVSAAAATTVCGAQCSTPRPPARGPGTATPGGRRTSPEKPTPTRRIGPISTGIEQQSARRARSASRRRRWRTAASRSGSAMLMSDFFSLTVTVRAPRPSFSRRAWACSPIGPVASRSWSSVVKSVGEGGLGADLLGLRVLGDRPVVDAAGQPVQRGPDRRAQDVGGLGVGQRRELADGLDAEPVQLLLGDRSDAPQPPHLQARRAARVPRRGGPPGCRRAWPGRRRSWRSACPSRRRRTRRDRSRREPWPAGAGRTAPTSSAVALGEFGGFAERLVERELLEHGHHRPDGLEDAPAGHAVDDPARRQHHRRSADQAARLVHGHRRPGAVHT